MGLLDFAGKLLDWIHKDCKPIGEYNNLQTRLAELSIDRDKYVDLLNQCQKNNLELISERDKALQLINEGWLNPYGWTLVDRKWNTISGLDIPPNSCITPNDRGIKQVALKLKGNTIEETAIAIKKWINKNIEYCFDVKNPWHPNFIEWYQPASFTFSCRKGDCEDMAILFQTMMHICGYADKIVCVVAVDANHLTKWANGEYLGHCYNRVLIDNEWIVFDANAGELQEECVYPEVKYETYVFNYFGMYKMS